MVPRATVATRPEVQARCTGGLRPVPARFLLEPQPVWFPPAIGNTPLTSSQLQGGVGGLCETPTGILHGYPSRHFISAFPCKLKFKETFICKKLARAVCPSKQEIHRRSARLRNTKYKSAPAAEKKVSTKGKGRRHIFKLKNPIKAPESVSTIITAESIFYKGVYYQIGDVVSVIDEQDGKPYYAQIRGFIQDQYCEKSAALTWLIPTLSSPRDQFDPASYIIGPEEDLPRKMEYLEFVCHAPSEYFKSRSSPFPTVPTRPEKGYIWTHVGPTPAITIKETVANHL
ncbi:GATA zinc finger domain-containing protein 1 [Carlito syrichta]|uniref:GATA zinc finger domain-containing protein 1 n=1 Tax=Carlito syrichta TaxID=1868482 RepID=A0A3Q0DE57_CARSF|nr:GATA zinc finger domain-containing protein 1 [Carlito syrichta]